MIVSFATQTITRQRAGTLTDGYGDTIEDWTTPDELDIEDCTVQPLYAEETIDPTSDAVPVRYSVIGPVDADILATDRIRFDGRTLRVEGEPARFEAGILDHVEFTMSEVTG